MNKQKALFVHVPKTAGSSIERTLRLNEKYGWIRNPFYLHHDPLFLLQETNDITEDTFIFSVVRNPFTRTYSYYNHFKRNNNIELSFKEFLQIIRNKISPTKRTPFIGYNQSYYLFGNNGLLGTSKIYKYENLSELEHDFGVVLKKINVGTYNSQDFFNDYGEDEKNLVRHICAEDFLNFGYSLEF